VDISFDPAKRDRTLAERGLDFADAGLVFAGVTATIQDVRHSYGEDRHITIGQSPPRPARGVGLDATRQRSRIISMRYAHASEEARRFDCLD
jgi:uncharacterized protein